MKLKRRCSRFLHDMMHVSRKRLHISDEIPWWYGYTYSEPGVSDTVIYMPIPLNMIYRVLRLVWIACTQGRDFMRIRERKAYEAGRKYGQYQVVMRAPDPYREYIKKLMDLPESWGLFMDFPDWEPMRPSWYIPPPGEEK